jgi:hypothetical protein
VRGLGVRASSVAQPSPPSRARGCGAVRRPRLTREEKVRLVRIGDPMGGPHRAVTERVRGVVRFRWAKIGARAGPAGSVRKMDSALD